VTIFCQKKLIFAGRSSAKACKMGEVWRKIGLFGPGAVPPNQLPCFTPGFTAPNSVMENIQTPNYFEFYGIPIALAVDPTAVRRIFLENSRKYHPDFHTLSPDAVQADVLELSTRNNEAFKTLSDPDRLLAYVLKITGTLTGDGEQGKLPQAFLMEMMDINEKIMSLEFDAEPGVYQSVMDTVNDLKNNLEASLGTLLQHWTAENNRDGDLEKAKDYFYKKKYLLRIIENISKFAPAFG
jgi:molecular chaperone HscB